MADFQLPNLGDMLDGAIHLTRQRPRIVCALEGCPRWTYRDVRLGDSLPAPAEAGWFEVELPSFDPRVRNVVFACSHSHGRLVRSGTKVVPGLSAPGGRDVQPGQ